MNSTKLTNILLIIIIVLLLCVIGYLANMTDLLDTIRSNTWDIYSIKSDVSSILSEIKYR